MNAQVRRLAVLVVGLLTLLAPSAAQAKGCPNRALKAMLAEAGQGINGRLLEQHEDHIVVLAESRYRNSIRFGEKVTIHGPSLPGQVQGRIGIVLRRAGGRWRATPDVVPGWRMANALSGLDPCPAPGITVGRVRITGRRAEVTLHLRGDVTSIRIDSGRSVRRRHFAEPGFTSIVETLTYRSDGRYRASFRAEGGFGPGCGDARRRFATARRTIRIG